MALPTQQEGVKAFLKLFRQTARERHRFEVFQDFVTLTACSLNNAILKDELREQEYMDLIGKYRPEDQQRFPELLGILVNLLDLQPRDVLGQLYMELELGNEANGQFFTPPELSEMMARMTDIDALLQDREFITLSEPTCGAGGLVLAFVKTMIDKGYNPGTQLWVQCIDLDRTSALISYIQLSLWNVPAEIIVGNTVSLEFRERWYTQRHVLGLWSSKLGRHRAHPASEPQKPAPPLETKVEPIDVEMAPLREQLGFDF